MANSNDVNLNCQNSICTFCMTMKSSSRFDRINKFDCAYSHCSGGSRPSDKGVGAVLICFCLFFVVIVVVVVFFFKWWRVKLGNNFTRVSSKS